MFKPRMTIHQRLATNPPPMRTACFHLGGPTCLFASNVSLTRVEEMAFMEVLSSIVSMTGKASFLMSLGTGIRLSRARTTRAQGMIALRNANEQPEVKSCRCVRRVTQNILWKNRADVQTYEASLWTCGKMSVDHV